MYKIENGRTIILNKNFRHPSIANYHMLPKEQLIEDGWIDDLPPAKVQKLETVQRVLLDRLKKQHDATTITIQSACKGEVKKYTFKDADPTLLAEQIEEIEAGLKSAGLWHDDSLDEHELYTLAELKQLKADLGQTIAIGRMQINKLQVRVKNAQTVQEAYEAVNSPITEEEMADIMMKWMAIQPQE